MKAILPIVAIDGPAGVGKTTTAGLLAEKLGLPRLDTGAMFRHVALRIGEAGLELSDARLRALSADWSFSISGSGSDTVLLCAGREGGPEIRSERISALASKLAARPEIRAILRDAQRRLGASTALVAEGRDMGTVVFPHAAFKFFLDARPEIRALRRWRQMEARGEPVDFEELSARIKARDEQDRTRATAPLRPAADAVIMDTSALDTGQVLASMLSYIEEHGGMPPASSK